MPRLRLIGVIAVLTTAALLLPAAASARHAPSLLTIKQLPTRGAMPKVLVKEKPTVRVLRAKLNGRPMRWPLTLWVRRSHQLLLGADDGLHFGRNHLSVTAHGRRGAFDRERRTIVVPRTGPLVGAGPDRRVVAGRRFKLDARQSRPAHSGAKLRYRWKIVMRPRGSKAGLIAASSARPTLRTDAVGTYRVKLTATEVGAPGASRPPPSASDIVTVSAAESVPPLGLPIETIVGKPGEAAETGIKIGTQNFWLGTAKGNAIGAEIIDRETLQVLYAAAYPGNAENAKTLAEKIAQLGSGNSALVVISNPASRTSGPINQAFVPIVASLGVPVATIKSTRGGWSAVGVSGSESGGWLGSGLNYDSPGEGNVAGVMSGYLQPIVKHKFAFTPAGRISFETSASAPAQQNTIAVGEAAYRSGPLQGCGLGGFQVEVLLAETLAPVAGATFTTNASCPNTAIAGQGEMLSFLKGTGAGAEGSTPGPKIVIVQSIGKPYDAIPSWNEIGAQLTRLGATESVFDEAEGSYALVGSIGVEGRKPLVEASSQLTNKPALLSGLFGQNREYAFVPQVYAPSNSPALKIGSIAYQSAEEWPASKTPGQRAALTYIAAKFGLNHPSSSKSCFVPEPGREWEDVRAEYCNTLGPAWATWAGTLRTEKFPAGHGFQSEEWNEVVKELAGTENDITECEFEYVRKIWALVKVLKLTLTESKSEAFVNLQAIAEEVETAIKPPPASEASGWWVELLANVMSVAPIEDEDIAEATGLLAGALYIAGQFIHGEEGASLFEGFKFKSTEVAQRLAGNYTTASAELGRLGNLLVTDAAKLKAVAGSKEFGTNETTLAEASQTITAGARKWSYETLLPVAYEAIGLLEGEPAEEGHLTNANGWACSAGFEETYHPFREAATSAQLVTQRPQTTVGVLVEVGSKLPERGGAVERPVTPPESLMKPLFETGKGGYGYIEPWFWRSAFDYPNGIKPISCKAPY